VGDPPKTTENPWEAGGATGSDWSPNSSPALANSAVALAGAGGKGTTGSGTVLFLDDPWIEPQKYSDDCWAAALVSWSQTTQLGKFQASRSQDDVINYYSDKGLLVDGSNGLKADYDTWKTVTEDFGCNTWFNRSFSDLKSSDVLTWLRLAGQKKGSGYFLVWENEKTSFKHVYIVYGYSDQGQSSPWWYAMNPDSGITQGTCLASAPIPYSPGRWAASSKSGIPSAGSVSSFFVALYST
jgi:hypothetical protein